MVFADDVDEGLRQVVLARERLSVGNMGDDGLSRVDRHHVKVKIDPILLVLGVKLGLQHLSHIVIKGRSSTE